MAVHRTKQQKIKAQIRRESNLYSLPASDVPVKLKTTAKTANNQPAESFSLDYALLQKDLLRTALSTAVVLVILAGLTQVPFL